jgi:hypothetical protein
MIIWLTADVERCIRESVEAVKRLGNCRLVGCFRGSRPERRRNAAGEEVPRVVPRRVEGPYFVAGKRQSLKNCANLGGVF